jgi:hypothetical protein
LNMVNGCQRCWTMSNRFVVTVKLIPPEKSSPHKQTSEGARAPSPTIPKWKFI